MARGIDTKPYLEWLDGAESVVEGNDSRCGITVGEIASAIDERLGTSGSTMSYVHLRLAPDTILLPDVSFYRYDRLRDVPRDERELPNIPPDIVAEIHKPNDRPGFREEKIRRYLAWGCPLVIEVDPASRTIRERYADDAADMALKLDATLIFAPLDRLGF